MGEYILFLDETNPTTVSPYFCLAGFVIERKEYENILIPKINDCKKILGNPHIVFHYTDMKKSTGEFKMLNDGKLRSQFWNKLQNVLQTSKIYTMGTYLDKVFYTGNFPKDGCKDAYLLAMQKIVSNYVYFLFKHKSRGSIMCESRNLKEDMLTQRSYYNIANNGTDIFTSDMVKKHLTTISFNIKKDNCIGLQVADMIPLAFIRNLHKKPDSYNIYQTLSSKLYDGDIGKSDIFGFTQIF